MTAAERRELVYATQDGRRVLRLDAPAGLIFPPTIEAHRPMVGPELFVHAETYGIEIDEEVPR